MVDLSPQATNKESLFRPFLYGQISIFASIGARPLSEGGKLDFSCLTTLPGGPVAPSLSPDTHYPRIGEDHYNFWCIHCTVK